MKLPASDSIKAAGMLAALGVGVFVAWKLTSAARSVGAAAGEAFDYAADLAAHELNPASPDNLAYQGATSVYQAVTGDEVNSLGTGIYEATHNDAGDFDLSGAFGRYTSWVADFWGFGDDDTAPRNTGGASGSW